VAVAAAQIREVVERLVAAGHWQDGGTEILVVLDAGYDAPRIAHLLADRPVQILGWMCSGRVLCRLTSPRRCDLVGCRPERGGGLVFGDVLARLVEGRPWLLAPV
jgi:hypothetical protein